MASTEPNPYDEVQYLSHPYHQTHPDHLYTLGRLFGVEAVPYSEAHVLELGCASGGNIIPMAANAPLGQYLGIDLAKKQIEAGQSNIQELGLKNIKLEHQSIQNFDSSSEKFDYIICHGIYSWVDSEVRDKIMSVCHNHLKPNGIAYVSYNTFPGWNMVKSVRDMMLYHAQNFESPQRRAQEARGILKFIVDGLEGENSPYALLLRNEINLLSKQPDSYLLHDHLESVNYPVYLYQFVEHANKYKLAYLSDTPLFTMYPNNLPKKVADELNKIHDIVRVGQYMDFVRNQRFRCTLLCHQEHKINRNLNTDDITKFHVAYNGKPTTISEDKFKEGEPVEFVGSGITLTVRNYLSKVAMTILNEAKGLPMNYNELVDKVMSRAKESDRNKVQITLNRDLNLLRLALGGLVTLHSSLPNYLLNVTEKPQVMSFVRYQAKEGPMVTNQRHQVVGLNPVERVLVSYLDGKHSKKDLIKKISEHVEKKDFTIKGEGDSPVTDPKDIALKSEQFCEQILMNFAKNALLVNP
ncbi:MAG TPA: class I SAM-dependent methyltransferase [Gammaproteobacteria bacterium]|nr:class I SAM-dependent methyltransferase [Gammaproteobacteria bacterium]